MVPQGTDPGLAAFTRRLDACEALEKLASSQDLALLDEDFIAVSMAAEPSTTFAQPNLPTGRGEPVVMGTNELLIRAMKHRREDDGAGQGRGGGD